MVSWSELDNRGSWRIYDIRQKRRGWCVLTLCLDAKSRTAATIDVTRLEDDCGLKSSVDDETMMSVVPDRTILLTNTHGVWKYKDGRRTGCGRYRSSSTSGLLWKRATANSFTRASCYSWSSKGHTSTTVWQQIRSVPHFLKATSDQQRARFKHKNGCKSHGVTRRHELESTCFVTSISAQNTVVFFLNTVFNHFPSVGFSQTNRSRLAGAPRAHFRHKSQNRQIARTSPLLMSDESTHILKGQLICLARHTSIAPCSQLMALLTSIIWACKTKSHLVLTKVLFCFSAVHLGTMPGQEHIARPSSISSR